MGEGEIPLNSFEIVTWQPSLGFILAEPCRINKSLLDTARRVWNDTLRLCKSHYNPYTPVNHQAGHGASCAPFRFTGLKRLLQSTPSPCREGATVMTILKNIAWGVLGLFVFMFAVIVLITIVSDPEDNTGAIVSTTPTLNVTRMEVINKYGNPRASFRFGTEVKDDKGPRVAVVGKDRHGYGDMIGLIGEEGKTNLTEIVYTGSQDGFAGVLMPQLTELATDGCGACAGWVRNNYDSITPREYDRQTTIGGYNMTIKQIFEGRRFWVTFRITAQ